MLEFILTRFTIRRFFSVLGAAFAVLLTAAGALLAYLFFTAENANVAAGAAFAGLAVLLLLLGVLAAVVQVWARKKMLLPVRYLSEDMEKIQNNIPAEKRVFYQDEIGGLAERFYAMKAQMEENYRNLEKISFTDALTGLYNRRYFVQVARQQMQMSIRTKHPLCILIADVDHFKSINDTYGHLIGDEALKHAANMVRGSVRESDICARFGGEEFIVLLNNTSLENGAVLAEKMRAALEKTPCKTEADTLRMTISIGVSEIKPEEGGVNDAINFADRALYDAKSSGRNKVCTEKK